MVALPVAAVGAAHASASTAKLDITSIGNDRYALTADGFNNGYYPYGLDVAFRLWGDDEWYDDPPLGREEVCEGRRLGVAADDVHRHFHGCRALPAHVTSSLSFAAATEGRLTAERAAQLGSDAAAGCGETAMRSGARRPSVG